MSATLAAPIRYAPGIEEPEADEAETGRELTETMRGITEKTFADGGHAIRSVHAKSHGLVEGTMEVMDGLAPELAQGLFARAGRYPVLLRFPTIPGDILPDRVSAPRGVSMKIVGVDGPRLPSSGEEQTQDFVLVNGPAFSAPTAKAFLRNLKLLAATTDRAPKAKEVLSKVLRETEAVIEAFGGESVTLKTMGGHPPTHILGDTFFSQAPLLWGDYMAKVQLAPVSANLTALKDASLDIGEKDDAIRDATVDFFNREDEAVWEFRVQLCRNLETMPIEDASVVWPEDESPYLPVARVTARRQTAWSEERSRAVDDGRSFSVWHGLAAHRPLGSIMRVRKAAYEMSARFRSERNATRVTEPKAGERLAG